MEGGQRGSRSWREAREASTLGAAQCSSAKCGYMLTSSGTGVLLNDARALVELEKEVPSG